MIVNLEFFDEEPIANVITSLNYEIDKTIFFGYAERMGGYQKNAELFLKKVCGVQDVEFYPVDKHNLKAIVDVMRNVVQKEMDNGNNIHFDLTGGEDLLLVAFGILANTFRAPMHRFDVRTSKVSEFCEGEHAQEIKALSTNAKYRPISMDLDQYIFLYHGAINYRQKKGYKTVTVDGAEDIEHVWNLSRKYGDKWVHYSSLLRKFPPDADLMVYVEEKTFVTEIKKHRRAGKLKDFHRFLSECSTLGVFHVYAAGRKGYRFQYKNSSIKQLFWDSGSILEMYTFLLESRKDGVDDCRVGVHIDWDGVVHASGNMDVLNEIDVMSIHDNIPTFISCKIGNVDQMSLYELETVAERFGGKYAKKVLATAQKLSPGHLRRAEEMGIEVRVVG